MLLRQWFALRVRSRCEKVVAAAVRLKGYEDFLPVARCRQRWSDRFKSVDVPLFPGYVFCRTAPEHRLPLLTIPGVMEFVGIGRTPVPIAEAEIVAIQAAIRSEVNVQPWQFLEAGTRVRLESGPLVGVEGFLVESGDRDRVVVAVSLLKQSVAIEIQKTWCEPPKALNSVVKFG
jgi:transcription antitermination factor NusG